MTHTPGYWYWDVRPEQRVFRLVSPHGGRMIVMDFTRWGMQSAQPRFSDRNGELRGGVMDDGSKIDLSKNPDACLIAAAPLLLDAAEEALEVVRNTTIPRSILIDALMKLDAAIAAAKPKP